VNAPDGTLITFSIVSGPGSFVGGGNTCTTAGGTGSCTVQITSGSPGTTVVKAATDVVVLGVSLHRETGDGLPGDSANANKTWVDANIQITPQSDTNPVGATHTFTGHVNVNPGTGFVNAPDGTQISFTIDSGPGAFTSPNPCTTAGGTGSCTITLLSNTPGTTVVSAHTTVSVGGVSLTRHTNGVGANSGAATKLWADDTVATHVRNAANQDITNTTVPAGTVVHDEATVSKAAGTPASVPDPTGTVDFTLYDNGTCNGAVLATDPGKALNASGTATSATFTTPNVTASYSYLAHYNGDANYPAHNGPCEPFNVLATPEGQITPTQVDCTQFASGTAPTLDQINYSVSGGKIGQNINPGVFFFWTNITTTVPNQVVTVSQTNTSTNNAALFTVHQGWARLYQGDCSSYTTGTVIAGGTGASFTVPTPGSYIIGVKYQTKSIAGTTAPVPADITYNFTTSLGGSTGASVLLKKQ